VGERGVLPTTLSELADDANALARVARRREGCLLDDDCDYDCGCDVELCDSETVRREVGRICRSRFGRTCRKYYRVQLFKYVFYRNRMRSILKALEAAARLGNSKHNPIQTKIQQTQRQSSSFARCHSMSSSSFDARTPSAPARSVLGVVAISPMLAGSKGAPVYCDLLLLMMMIVCLLFVVCCRSSSVYLSFLRFSEKVF
jgi:hypothetical protein